MTDEVRAVTRRLSYRLYTLYERPRGTRRWTAPYPDMRYRKADAVRVFQDALLAPALKGLPVERCLRPVR